MSGAAKLLTISSFPVLTRVMVEVSTRSESEVRKKRSAGRVVSLGVAIVAAMADFSIVASAGRGRYEAERKNNSQRVPSLEFATASAARAAFRVRLEMGTPEISLRGNCFAPRARARAFTRTRKGKSVMAR